MLVDRIFHYSSMIQSIISYLIPLNSIFEVAIESIPFNESIQYISYVPIGAILDLNKISDQSILIDYLHYVVTSKYHYFWFWIFQIILAGDLDPFFSDPSIKRFIFFIKNRR
ncbi:hypothetical protein ES332_D02G093700v1 [Gossypium tomentosum]|uniref:Uncharacterized protein n=1 Tax=Gossypium tomentosum TaxID=34277 RepID=A0A5D2LV10_GOSTO|nr:hypothetical protein ES332_D02G093700v1 [Gossypium tomentosum]